MMASRPLSSLRADEIEAVLTPERVKMFQTLQSALGGGVLLFAVVVLFLPGRAGQLQDPASSFQLLRLLTSIHMVWAAGSLVLVSLVDRFVFRDLSTPQPAQENLPEKAVGLLQQAVLIRLALLEAVAFFGLVVCLLAKLNGLLATHPAFALNGLSAAGFIVYTLATYPNRDRLLRRWQDRIAGSSVS